MARSAQHALLFTLGMGQPATQTSKNEQNALQAFARGKSRAVEIGVFEGFNTRLIAEVLQEEGILLAVDPFFKGRLPICWGEVIARRHVRRSRVEDRVRFVKALSWEAVSQVNGNFDFIFVDGDHSWTGISRDWQDWSALIVVGGLIALHDTCRSGASEKASGLDSYRFYEEVIQQDARFELVDQVDTLSVLRRR